MPGMLTDPDLMRALSFYGGGAATVVGALWVAYKHFTAKAAPARIPSPDIRADRGVAAGGKVAAGGDISVTTVPTAAWIVIGLGILGLIGGVLLGPNSMSITDGAQVGGNMENSVIRIEK